MTNLQQTHHTIVPNEYHVWTDGAAKGNPGPSAYAVHHNGKTKSGYLGHGTNNEAEVFAILVAAQVAPSNCTLVVHTDSRTAIAWLSGRGNPGQRARNTIRKWQDTIVEKSILPRFVHVKGHGDDANNILVDGVASTVAATGP